jgi:hypothetical protein
MWQNNANGVLGLFTIVASYLYVPSGTGQIVMLITGLVVAVLGFWGAASLPSDHHYRQIQH